MATLIKLFYAAALATLVILLVAFGIRTFYDGPDSPDSPFNQPLTLPPSAEEQARFNEAFRLYEEERADYHRNVFIIVSVLGLASVIAGVLLSGSLDAIRLGLIAGGVGLLIYGVVQASEDLGDIGAAPIFVVAVIGLVIVLGAGYYWQSGRLPWPGAEDTPRT